MPADAPAFDLQSHSTRSDGALPPAEVVAQRGRSRACELLALTDHDTVDGVAEAQSAAREHGIAFSPAAELSSVHGEHEDLHILGYELDPADPGLRAALEDFRADRGRRICAMADRLRELGFALDNDGVRGPREPLGRPHLADAVLAHPDNAERLAREGITGKKALFPPYLVPGAMAYVARSRPTVEEAIDGHPRRRRRGGVGAPVLGRRRSPRRCCARSSASRPRDSTASSVFYPSTRASRRCCCTTPCEARGLLVDRLGGLPRTGARALQPLPRRSTSTAAPRGSARSANRAAATPKGAGSRSARPGARGRGGDRRPSAPSAPCRSRGPARSRRRSSPRQKRSKIASLVRRRDARAVVLHDDLRVPVRPRHRHADATLGGRHAARVVEQDAQHLRDRAGVRARPAAALGQVELDGHARAAELGDDRAADLAEVDGLRAQRDARVDAAEVEQARPPAR